MGGIKRSKCLAFVSFIDSFKLTAMLCKHTVPRWKLEWGENKFGMCSTNVERIFEGSLEMVKMSPKLRFPIKMADFLCLLGHGRLRLFCVDISVWYLWLLWEVAFVFSPKHLLHLNKAGMAPLLNKCGLSQMLVPLCPGHTQAASIIFCRRSCPFHGRYTLRPHRARAQRHKHYSDQFTRTKLVPDNLAKQNKFVAICTHQYIS